LKNPLPKELPVFIATRTVMTVMVRMVYPFLPVFARGLGVDMQAMALAVTARSASGVLGPLLASLGDSRGRKTGMLLGLALFVVAGSLMVIWPTYPAFVLALVLSMLGVLAVVPTMHAYLGDRIPYERRGLAMALTETGWSLSFILGVPAMGWLISRFSWLAPFPVLAGLGLVFFFVLAWMLPSDRTSSHIRSGLWVNLRSLFAYPPAVAGILIGAAMSGSNELVNLTFAVWLEDSFFVKIAALAAASVVIGASELTGEMLVSASVDRLGKRRAVATGLALNSLAALALPLLGRSLSGALVGLFLFYLAFEYSIVSCMPLISEVMPAARATFMAVFIASTSLGRALSSLAAPLLYELGRPAQGKPELWWVVLAAVLLNMTALWALSRIRERVSSGEDRVQ
jgi:MFS transporter, DHA1 family, inner membrane transport protein